MDIRYDVAQLFQLAFGVNLPVFVPYPLLGAPPAPIYDFSGLQEMETFDDYNDFDNLSYMGTPILFQTRLMAGNYKVYEKGTLAYKSFETVWFPPATMFSFRRAKNIIRTNVLGSDGTVKEIFGFDDWIIDVKGLCLDEPGKSARSQLRELLSFEKIADAVSVEGALFNTYDINRVCISDWSSNVPQGKPGVIAFECQLISDQDMEFQLKA